MVEVVGVGALAHLEARDRLAVGKGTPVKVRAWWKIREGGVEVDGEGRRKGCERGPL